jgi:hypothetical protein
VNKPSGNASPTRRAAFSVRYAGRDAHWNPRPNFIEPKSKLHTGDPLILDGVFPITLEKARVQA